MAPHIRNLGTRNRFTPSGRLMSRRKDHLPIFKYDQENATLHNLFIYLKCSTCFRRFFRPSSGARNCIYSIGYFVKPLLLPATVVEEIELQVPSRR